MRVQEHYHPPALLSFVNARARDESEASDSSKDANLSSSPPLSLSPSWSSVWPAFAPAVASRNAVLGDAEPARIHIRGREFRRRRVVLLRISCEPTSQLKRFRGAKSEVINYDNMHT